MLIEIGDGRQRCEAVPLEIGARSEVDPMAASFAHPFSGNRIRPTRAEAEAEGSLILLAEDHPRSRLTPQPLQCHDIVAFLAERFAQQHFRARLACNQTVREIHPVRMQIQAQPAGSPTFTEQIHGFLSRVAPNWPKLAYFSMSSNTYSVFVMCIKSRNYAELLNILFLLNILQSRT